MRAIDDYKVWEPASIEILMKNMMNAGSNLDDLRNHEKSAHLC